MLKEYFKELKGLDLYEEEHGFILYKLLGSHLYIVHQYTKPEHRRSGYGHRMASNLLTAAKETLGATHLICDVEPSNGNATASIAFIIAYGCKVLSSHDDEIKFIKEL